MKKILIYILLTLCANLSFAQLQLPFGVQVLNPLPLEGYYYNPATNLPWVSVTAVNTGIASTIRYQGMTVNINGTEYWYGAGTGNANLVQKISGLTGSGATQQIAYFNSSSSIIGNNNLYYDGTNLYNSGGNLYVQNGSGGASVGMSYANGGLTIGSFTGGYGYPINFVDNNGSILYASLSIANGFRFGTLGYTDTNILGAFQSSINSYNQFIIQNTNSGVTASSDIIVNNNQSTASTYYGDFGMNSSGFSGSGAFNAPNNVYLTSTSSDLALGTTTSNAIHFVVNNGSSDAATISSSGIFSLANPLAVTSGGTGTSTPSLVAGTNVTITGTWPNQTINSTSGGGVTSFSAGTTGLIPNSATTGPITLAGTLATTNGGTGLTSFSSAGNILFSSSTSSIGQIADVAAGSVLISTGVGVAPGWSGASLNLSASSTISAASSISLWPTTTTGTDFSAVTTYTLGGSATSAVTASLFANATASATTKTINIGTGGLSGSSTILNLGSNTAGAAGTLNLGVSTLVQTASQTTLSHFNTVSTTINEYGAATSYTLGGTATTALNATLFANPTISAVTKSINIGTGGVSGSTTNIILNSSVSGATGTTTIGGTSLQMTQSTGSTTTAFVVTGAANSGGFPSLVQLTPASHTNVIALPNDFNFVGNRLINFNISGNAKYGYGSFTLNFPTYTANSAFVVSEAVGLWVGFPPAAGTNVTTTNSFSIKSVGNVKFDGQITELQHIVSKNPDNTSANPLTSLTVSGTTATITYTSTPSLAINQYLWLENFIPTTLNGWAKITAISGNVITATLTNSSSSATTLGNIAPGVQAFIGAGGGSGGTVLVQGNDVSGVITITTGTSPSGLSTIATINFLSGYSIPPTVVISPSSFLAAQLGTSSIFVNSPTSTSGFQINSSTSPLAASSTYIYTYHVIQ
jgi:hypothetical protein